MYYMGLCLHIKLSGTDIGEDTNKGQHFAKWEKKDLKRG